MSPPLKYIMSIGPIVAALSALIGIGIWIGVTKSTGNANAASLVTLDQRLTKHEDAQARHIESINSSISAIQKDLAIITVELKMRPYSSR